jgi:hypothetical protein
MSSTDQSKPGGKSGQRSRKPKQQNKKPDQRQHVKPDQRPDVRQDEKELIEAEIAPAETFTIAEEASTETFSIATEASEDTSSIDAVVASSETFPVNEASTGVATISPAVASTETPSKGALVPVEALPIATVSVDIFFIGFLAVANAYREYTRRSLEETISFVEKLAAVRSFDKAIEVQSEFAQQSCGNFLADSQKILRLYSELARQVLRPFERLVMRVTAR